MQGDSADQFSNSGRLQGIASLASSTSLCTSGLLYSCYHSTYCGFLLLWCILIISVRGRGPSMGCMTGDGRLVYYKSHILNTMLRSRFIPPLLMTLRAGCSSSIMQLPGSQESLLLPSLPRSLLVLLLLTS